MKTIRVTCGDRCLTTEVPDEVDAEAVGRALGQLSNGAIPFWLAPKDRDFVADIIGSFERAEVGESGAKIAEG